MLRGLKVALLSNDVKCRWHKTKSNDEFIPCVMISQ